MRRIGGRTKNIFLILVLTCIVGTVYINHVARVYNAVNTPKQEWVLKSSVPNTPARANPEALREPNRNLPVRLIIPSIHVDAPILYMGITKSGTMDVPKNITDTGWYKNGPLPGNRGSAVIAGHIDGLRGQPGVFAELSKLPTGSTVKVTDLNGLSTTFVVRMTKTYAQNDQPDEVFHSTDGIHLNLITCTGNWNSTNHQFSQRLVVFADKE